MLPEFTSKALTSHKALLGLVVLTCLVVVRSAYSFFTNPLRDIPGPIWARVSRIWLAREYFNGSHEQTNIRLHEKYGPIVRIAPNQYSIDDPSTIKQIYGHGSQFVKSEWYHPQGNPGQLNLFTFSDPKEHADARRKVSMAYSMTSLLSYESSVNECSAILLDKLAGFAKSNEVVNMSRWLQFYAFDVIAQITFSQRLGFLEQGMDVGNFISFLETGEAFAVVIGLFPGVYSIIEKIVIAAGANPLAAQQINDMVKQQIATFKGSVKSQLPAGALNFIQKISAPRTGNNSTLSDLDISLAAWANVGAGSDTTSVSLSAILYHLIENAAVLDKLRCELDQAAKDGVISNPITFQEAQRLPYLQAVIKEALRMHPATGYTMPRVVPSGGRDIAGRFFPEGTYVGVNAWVAHRNKSVFGQDASKFNPERWLCDDKKTLTLYEANFLTFGQGARTCIGKHISLLEISKLIPQLVLRFDFIREDIGEWKCHNHWFVKPVQFPCWIKERCRHRNGGLAESQQARE